MSLRLALLQRLVPKFAKLRMLDELTRITAGGFAAEVPHWTRRSFDDRVRAYAEFTAREAARLVADADRAAIEAAQDRLRRGATNLGARMRRGLGLRRPDEAFGALKLLYHQIGIEVSGGLVGSPAGDGSPASRPFGEADGDLGAARDSAAAAVGAPGPAGNPAAGEIMVSRCLFADYYTEPVCRVIAALDEGIAAGLFDGASLEFTQRLTEGKPCCRAVLRPLGRREAAK
jgi:hypothetical protein